MIIPVDETNLFQAAIIHSLSWQDSHLSFCSPDFVELHTPEHQQKYMEEKRNNGSSPSVSQNGFPGNRKNKCYYRRA